jgi:hypothetical protein
MGRARINKVKAKIGDPSAREDVAVIRAILKAVERYSG